MPKEKKTAGELAQMIKEKLAARGIPLNLVQIQVYPITQLGWDASANSGVSTAEPKPATVAE